MNTYHCHYRSILRLGAAFIVALYVHLWFQWSSDEYVSLHAKTIKEVQQESEKQGKNNIKFVTYNMWCNYLVSSKSNYKERFEGLAAGVSEFDVVMVQEVFVLRSGPLEFSNCATSMVEAMEKKGFRYRTSFTDTVPYLFGQSNGIAIFSKVPIDNAKSIIYNDAAIGERVNNKGFTYAELSLSGKKIFVFNTHTDAHKEEIRTAQMEQLVETVASLPQSAYFIVGGDLNINPNNPPEGGNEKEYFKLIAQMKKKHLIPVFTERNATHLNGGSYDYVFIGPNMKLKDHRVINLLTTKKEMVSDHYGLYMEVELS